jgi:hypothetical protein
VSVLILPSRGAAAILTANLRLMPNDNDGRPTKGSREVTDWRLPALWIVSAALVLVGIVDIASSDITGYLLAAAGIAAGVLVYRTVVPLLIWLGVAAIGYYDYTSGAAFGLLGVAAGIGGAALVVSCIVRPARDLTPTPIDDTSRPPVPDAFQPPSSGLEWTDHQAAQTGQLEASPPTPAPELALAKPPAVELAAADQLLIVRTIGGFQVSSGGKDLTGELLARPILCFIWLITLVRALAGDGRLSRASLADEAAPGLSISQQLQRARGHRRDLRAKLPRALSQRIRDDGEFWRFDLESVKVDVIRLRRLWAQCQESRGLLSNELAAEITDALVGLGSGDFLPLWEELKDKINPESTSAEQVQHLRVDVDEMHARLVLALAQHHRTRSEAARAINPLRAALDHMPEREDLAKALITAYQESGQLQEAAAVRDRYLKEF